MTLTLSSTEQRQLGAAIHALLSPLAHESREDWFRDVSSQLCPLVGGHSTIVSYSSDRPAQAFSPELPELADGFTSVAQYHRGELHFNEPAMDELTAHARKSRALAVFTSEILNRLTGNKLRRSLFYNDVARPLGAYINYGMGIVGGDGEALLGVNARRSKRDPLSEDTLALLSLLGSAFQAGFEMLARLDASNRALAAMIDTLSDGVFVYDTVGGRQLHRNAAVIALSASDPDFFRVEQRALAVARALYGVNRHADSAPLPRLEDLRTSNARYSFRASVLPIALFKREQVVLVAVQRHGIRLPTARMLSERFGLTPRESDVALRLARGDGDAKVARELGLSQHTVRHHTEHIFQKLAVHTRKALALLLVG